MTIKITTLIVMFLFFSSVAYSQTRTVTGKVIDETFQLIPGVNIFTSNTTQLGKTDSVENLSVHMPFSTNFLKFGAVGLEWKHIHLQNDCNHVEVILLFHSNYDFISLQEVDRLRRKEFKKLPKLHAKGFEN